MAMRKNAGFPNSLLMLVLLGWAIRPQRERESFMLPHTIGRLIRPINRIKLFLASWLLQRSGWMLLLLPVGAHCTSAAATALSQ